MRRLKILVMGEYSSDVNTGAGGTEIQTVRALERLGHKIDTVWAQDLLPRRVEHGGLYYLCEFPYRLRSVLLDRLRQQRYDVVHVSGMHGYLAAKAYQRLGAGAFIHRSHGLELRVARELARWERVYGSDKRRLSRRIGSRVLGHLLQRRGRKIAVYADGHIVSATQCKDFLQSELAVRPARVAVVPQAAPDAYVEVPPRRMSTDRLRSILYVGQFAFVKAPMVLAAVVDGIISQRKDVEVTWVCAAAHHRQARELLSANGRRHVKFLDWRPQEALMGVYDQHGTFLFPSFFEGFGKTCLEAMSRGLCVIAADNGGMRDVIEHGVTGLLVPTGDAGAMTQAYLNMLENLEAGLALSAGARKAAEGFSWARVARETAAFYEDTLRGKTA